MNLYLHSSICIHVVVLSKTQGQLYLPDPNAAADGRSYFHFKYPFLKLSGTAFFPFAYKELNLIGHEDRLASEV
jgi:hypothetical protein